MVPALLFLTRTFADKLNELEHNFLGSKVQIFSRHICFDIDIIVSKQEHHLTEFPVTIVTESILLLSHLPLTLGTYLQYLS